MRNESHMNYLRRKTADEAELWAADRIEELEREVERLNKIKSRTRQAELQSENGALLAEIAELVAALERIATTVASENESAIHAVKACLRIACEAIDKVRKPT